MSKHIPCGCSFTSAGGKRAWHIPLRTLGSGQASFKINIDTSLLETGSFNENKESRADSSWGRYSVQGPVRDSNSAKKKKNGKMNISELLTLHVNNYTAIILPYIHSRMYCIITKATIAFILFTSVNLCTSMVWYSTIIP